MPRKRTNHRREHGAESDDLVEPKTITGKELNEIEELSARLTTLIEMLDEKGILNLKEYRRMVAMRLHEISKAGATTTIKVLQTKYLGKIYSQKANQSQLISAHARKSPCPSQARKDCSMIAIFEFFFSIFRQEVLYHNYFHNIHSLICELVSRQHC
jgi:hypothetical protein